VDNAFSVAQVRPLIPASPDSTILVTSRRQARGLLLAGFHPVDLDYLTPDAGAALLASLLGRSSGTDTSALELLTKF
jgi:hypothetical protein